MAMRTPPCARSGDAISTRAGRDDTARAVTTAYLAGCASAWSSERSGTARMDESSLRKTSIWLSASAFLATESSSQPFLPVTTQSGTPGSPPPVPISHSRPGGAPLTSGKQRIESTRCSRMDAVGSTIRVRLRWEFISINASRYSRSRARCESDTSSAPTVHSLSSTSSASWARCFSLGPPRFVRECSTTRYDVSRETSLAKLATPCLSDQISTLIV